MHMRIPDAGCRLSSSASSRQKGEDAALPEVNSELDLTLEFLRENVAYSLVPRQRQSSGDLGSGGRADWFPRSLQDLAADDAEGFARHSRFAHCADDVILVARFAEIIGTNVISPTGEREAVKQESLQKKVLQGVKLMHLCDYSYSDVVVTLAYATVYFQSTFVAIGDKMTAYEASHVCVLLIYLAHSFILDETCPLRIWHKHIFRKYCNLKVLDSALFRVFQLRDYQLRISEEEERAALSALLGLEIVEGPNGAQTSEKASSSIST